ncbi:hypothetical protein [Streptomyces telluris]|uniref:Uncharacterized protein n=1 Tax=Streptomyces telluris TaxID=2720021 RepID=A0A9X2RMP0_9ACTN|nr:hypothetical protein [Streptomyces telluris]MCQ8769561.1 hypothetical protein [Streptomyces telluris]NJP78142.1 hypothetical protein [Streptomyces telluris]
MVGATVTSGVLAAAPVVPVVPAVLRRRAARALRAGQVGYLHDGREVRGQVRMP